MNSSVPPKRIYAVGSLRYTLGGVLLVCSWLLWGGFCYSMLVYMLVPTLLPLTLDSFHASGALIGLVVGSIPAAMNFVMNPILSTTSDRLRSKWGRRIPYLAFATPLISLFVILLGWTREIAVLLNQSLLPHASPELLGLILVCVFAILFQFFNLIIGSIYYYIFADVIPHEFIGRFMAFLTLSMTASGFVFNYYLMEYALEYSAWVYTVIGILFAVSFAAMCFFVKEGEYPPPPRNQAAHEPFAKRMIGWIRLYFRQCYRNPFFLMLFLGTAMTQVSTVCRSIFNLLFATKELHLTEAQFGKIMGIGSLVSLGVVLLIGYLMDKLHPLRIFLWSGIPVILINLWGYFYAVDYASFFVVGIAVVIIYSIQGQSIVPMYIALFPPEKYGQFSSANMMINSLLVIIANWGGGLAIDRFGYRFIFIWDLFFTTVATGILIYVYIRWRQLGGGKHYLAPEVE
ncbi:MFS transporter [Victivallis vadensis]|uniref:MFS transporter n=1 Tax=Victivallis vadensis TaxID=172901 RepID=UPI003D05DCEB